MTAWGNQELARNGGTDRYDGPSEPLSTDGLQRRCRELGSALEEKEAALREMQHRAKNSLQLVMSLLRLSHHRVSDPVARSVYDQTLQRVEVLGILYRLVHETGAGTHVDLARFLKEIATAASGHVEADMAAAPPEMDIVAEPIPVSLYTAMPLGLIINELVTQGLRNSYPDRGRITLHAARMVDGGVGLTIESNGRALPAGLDPEADASSALVEALCTQIGADIDNRPGSVTSVRLSFHL